MDFCVQTHLFLLNLTKKSNGMQNSIEIHWRIWHQFRNTFHRCNKYSIHYFFVFVVVALNHKIWECVSRKFYYKIPSHSDNDCYCIYGCLHSGADFILGTHLLTIYFILFKWSAQQTIALPFNFNFIILFSEDCSIYRKITLCIAITYVHYLST